ncbi:MAG: type II toxin-antitoxin system VapC family toxin [Oscillospiraceae bacterium]|nr:type II toxin-antitoxin system VapC family toxin [Oscillospiraceae bacterium]
MRYLLDTHTLLWYCENPDKLSSSAREIIYNDHSQIYVSTASLWEFAIKYSIGKLKFEGGFPRLCELIKQADFVILPIIQSYIAAMIDLPFIHRDPFDRLLASTAYTDGLTILTADENIQKYDVLSAW